MSREYIDNSRPQQQSMASLITGYEPCSPKPGPITSSSAVKPSVNSGPQHENGDEEQRMMITQNQAECNEEQSMVPSQSCPSPKKPKFDTDLKGTLPVKNENFSFRHCQVSISYNHNNNMPK